MSKDWYEEWAVDQDIKQTKKIVKKTGPILHELFERLGETGLFYPVEGVKKLIAVQLDQYGGFDYVFKNEKTGQLIGIASRTQAISKSKRPYNTFTVRDERDTGTLSEFHKLTQAFSKDYIYPQMRMQIYYREGTEEILTAAVAKTKDVMDYISKGYASKGHTNEDKIGQASFYIVDWFCFKNKGYDIEIYQQNKQ